MKTKTFAITAYLLLLLLQSCVEPIVMVPEEEMPVVVHCVLTRNMVLDHDSNAKDPVQTLNLYYAKRISATGDYEIISDAQVSISGGGQLYVFTWNGDAWTSTFSPMYGTEYVLTVKLNDGRELHSKTRLPSKITIVSEPVYSGRSVMNSLAGYLKVTGCSEDVDIWMTALSGREYDIQHFFTNHPGADDVNLFSLSLQEMPVFEQIVSNLHTILDHSWCNGDKVLFENYLQSCAFLPAHFQFLKIHHPKDFDNGILSPLLLHHDHSSGNTEYYQCRDGFLLFVDTIDVASGYIGMTPTRIPVRCSIVSPEYDTYLGNLTNNAYHIDELANMYSMDLSYTNIEGGIGIFGSLYYSDGISGLL